MVAAIALVEILVGYAQVAVCDRSFSETAGRSPGGA